MKIKRDKLDELFSEYIRKRAIKEVGGCERCLTPKYDTQKEDGSVYPAWKQLQCCHFYSRGKRSIRYDPDNACGLDFGCHIYLDGHPLEKIEFFKERLGDKFDLLMARAYKPAKPDVEAITIYFQTKLKEVKQ